MATYYPELNPKIKLAAIYNLKRVEKGLLPINIDDYNFTLPLPYSGPRSVKNTKVYLLPKTSTAEFGRITIYYDRIDLATITGAKVSKGTATAVSQLIDEINEELGIYLDVLDIEEAVLTADPTFVLTASPQCLLFTGQTTMGYY